VSAAGESDPALRISVVIPTWRDAGHLALLLPKLASLRGVAETIVVNASREARSKQIAQQHGAMFLHCSPPNRGRQMNAGAAAATGDVLLFQHVDTDLTEAHLGAIARALRNPRIVGGAFYRKFDERHPWLVGLEAVARFISRNGGALYGDQSIFVRREVFQGLGGFAEIPLMEDVEFSRRLRAAGWITLLDPPMQTSTRHHARKGAWRTTARNAMFIMLYRCGVSPFRLHRWYYSAAEVSANRGAAPA
jgi:rSAM/selenodomain-associated transferase 2